MNILIQISVAVLLGWWTPLLNFGHYFYWLDLYLARRRYSTRPQFETTILSLLPFIWASALAIPEWRQFLSIAPHFAYDGWVFLPVAGIMHDLVFLRGNEIETAKRYALYIILLVTFIIPSVWYQYAIAAVYGAAAVAYIRRVQLMQALRLIGAVSWYIRWRYAGVMIARRRL